jgi:hypothetical protein
MDAASLALVRAVPDAMASVGSARFRRLSAPERRVPLVDDQDLTAEGVTDFASRRTRCRWRALGTSLSEVSAAQRTWNPLGWLVMRYVTPAAIKAGLEWRELYYTPDGAWQLRDGVWRPDTGVKEVAPIRHDTDPVLALHFLSAVTEVLAVGGEEPVGEVVTTRIEGGCDLRLIEDQLTRTMMKTVRDRRSTLRGAQFVLWLDADGHARRLSVADLHPADCEQPFWSTIEFFDFGAELVTPDITAD